MHDENRESRIIEIARSVQAKLDALYRSVGNPEPGSALDQAGLRDGSSIVEDFVSHGEAGLAAEHLLYMITEPDIGLSQPDIEFLRGVCEVFGIEKETWRALRQFDA